MLIPSILYFTDVNLVHYTFFSEELLSNGGMYVEFWCIAYSVSKFFFFFKSQQHFWDVSILFIIINDMPELQCASCWNFPTVKHVFFFHCFY